VSDDLIVPEPAEPPLAGPERAMLEGWLDYHRATVLLTCDGLTGEQRRRRPVATSLMSLHGMVRHLAEVERNWFQRVLGQEPGLPGIFVSEEAVNGDWGRSTALTGQATWPLGRRNARRAGGRPPGAASTTSAPGCAAACG